MPLIFDMLVAAFVVRAGGSFQQKELAIIYLVAYIAIVLLGAGEFSPDNFIEKQLGFVFYLQNIISPAKPPPRQQYQAAHS